MESSVVAKFKDKALSLLKETAARFGYDLLPSFSVTLPEPVQRILQRVKPFSMTSEARLAAVCDAVRYVETRGIEGDIVECGVWKGGSSMALALALLEQGSTSRSLYLYDTFEGMSEPTQHDTEVHGGATAKSLLAQSDKEALVWAYSPLDEVKGNLASTGYPAELIHFIKGKVEDTIPETIPERIAILRLDTDWYESTRHELEHLFPRLLPGGVLIIDDYGHWDGARKAVDEYFSRPDVPYPLLFRVDYSGRMAIKA